MGPPGAPGTGTELLWGWGRVLATSSVPKSRAEGNVPSSHFGFIFNTPEVDGKQILSSLPNSTEMTIWKEKYKKKAATLQNSTDAKILIYKQPKPDPSHPRTQVARSRGCPELFHPAQVWAVG